MALIVIRAIQIGLIRFVSPIIINHTPQKPTKLYAEVGLVSIVIHPIFLCVCCDIMHYTFPREIVPTPTL